MIRLRYGKLKVILKQRLSRRYIYLKFSYAGNIQYHAIQADEIDELIDTLTEFRQQM